MNKTEGTVVELRPGPQERDRQRFARRQRRVDMLLRIGAPCALLLAWQIASSTEMIDPRFWPAPSEVFAALRDAIDSGVLQDAVIVSSRRILIGFVIGSTIGVIAGLLLGVIRPLRIALDPILSALYTVPKLAILPLLLLIFGLGDAPKLILIALSAFFITCISTTSATLAIPEGYLEPARSFGASPLQRFRHVLLPAVAPEVFVSVRLAAGTSVLVMVGIEFVQGGEGIGWLIWNSWQLFLTDRMYAGIITVAILGVVLQSAVKYLGQLLTPWTTAGRSGR